LQLSLSLLAIFIQLPIYETSFSNQHQPSNRLLLTPIAGRWMALGSSEASRMGVCGLDMPKAILEAAGRQE
jgi:hypothetical protein